MLKYNSGGKGMKKIIGKFCTNNKFIKFLIFILALIIITINANELKATKAITQKQDSIQNENPKIEIKVKKRYNNKGDIIGYDSTYLYSYTYSNGETKNIDIDSLLNQFKPFFFNNSPDIFNHSFDNFFTPDSIFKFNFFDNDFFQKNFKEDRFNFERIMRQMDSVKNEYFKQNYPNMKIKN